MWLMTKHGFYSIVQRGPEVFHVRSRERRDIENLVSGVPLSGAMIVETPDADYAYRIIADKASVLAVLAFLGKTLDYPNFKDKIHGTPDQRQKPYTKIWETMADALGAYGRKPRNSRSSKRCTFTEQEMEQVVGRFDRDDEFLVSHAYEDGGIDPLAARLKRAALNQLSDGTSTISRYAIWANTVRDNIRQADIELAAGNKREAQRLMRRAANTLSAFSELQAYFDPADGERFDRPVTSDTRIGY